MTNTVSQSSSDTRLAILEAAKKLFSLRGYAAVSTRDVAELAGVNLGSIQYHFRSKGGLFIETIHHMMKSEGCEIAQCVACESASNAPTPAAVQLAQFLRSFLEYLLVPHGPQPCRMMFREIFTETSEDPEMFEALVSTMTEEFARPFSDRLRKLVTEISPSLPIEESGFAVRSIVGQCFLYVTHRPFEERLMGVSFSDAAEIDKIWRHITRFSLLALGLKAERVDEAIAQAKSS